MRAKEVLCVSFLMFLGIVLSMPEAEAQNAQADSAVVVEQNLFHPSRSVAAPPPKPKPVAAPALVIPPPPPPKFVLSGVIIDENEAMALLQEPQLTQNKPVLVVRGREVGPYRLTEVQPDRVTLQSPTNTLTVLLLGPSTPVPLPRQAAPSVAPPAPRAVAPVAPAAGAPQGQEHDPGARERSGEGARPRHEAGAESPASGQHGGQGMTPRHESGLQREGSGPTPLPRAVNRPRSSNPLVDALQQFRQGPSSGEPSQPSQ